MTDGEAISVCAGCRSVNELRAKQSYNCGQAIQIFAEAGVRAAMA